MLTCISTLASRTSGSNIRTATIYATVEEHSLEYGLFNMLQQIWENPVNVDPVLFHQYLENAKSDLRVILLLYEAERDVESD